MFCRIEKGFYFCLPLETSGFKKRVQKFFEILVKTAK
jgi:hypothetical protein